MNFIIVRKSKYQALIREKENYDIQLRLIRSTLEELTAENEILHDKERRAREIADLYHKMAKDADRIRLQKTAECKRYKEMLDVK